MFGNQDQSNQDSAAALFGQPPPDPAVTPAGGIAPVSASTDMPYEPAAGPPEVPAVSEAASMEQTADALSTGSIVGHQSSPTNSHAPADVPAANDSLTAIKQQALEKLSPLLQQLEQSPEEKFKTTMMMLQATDNQALVQQAYITANDIPDEKARAQALLDVVNEINYFTHKDQPEH